MKTKLLRGCKTQKEKKDRQDYLLEHKFIFNLLSEICNEELQILEKEQLNKNRYDEPSWVYKQADYNGSKRTYEKLLDLLNIEVKSHG